MAGTAVDTVLFPLDTIKTRLQSGQAFSGRALRTGVFAGLRSAMAGSAPSAALFFVTYDTTKRRLAAATHAGPTNPALAHMAAASLGEVAASLVRVPTDVIKQRLQAGHHAAYGDAVRHLWRAGGLRGFYLGMLPTILRDVRWLGQSERNSLQRACQGRLSCCDPRRSLAALPSSLSSPCSCHHRALCDVLTDSVHVHPVPIIRAAQGAVQRQTRLRPRTNQLTAAALAGPAPLTAVAVAAARRAAGVAVDERCAGVSLWRDRRRAHNTPRRLKNPHHAAGPGKHQKASGEPLHKPFLTLTPVPPLSHTALQNHAWSLPVAVRTAVATIVRDHGLGGFALGIQARVLWLSAGGALFLGFYEAAATALSPHL